MKFLVVHHRQRGKTTTGSALDGAVLDFTQILAYLVHIMSRSQLYFGFGHFGWLASFFNNILAGLWLNCISSVEITLFLLADILLQHSTLFQYLLCGPCCPLSPERPLNLITHSLIIRVLLRVQRCQGDGWDCSRWLGRVSMSDKMSYRKISCGLKAMRLVV